MRRTISSPNPDPSQSGTANVAIAGGPNILTLHPSSIYAGAAQGFTLRVDGSGFAAWSPGPGSTLLAIAANATTLARMRFEELAQQATAVARLRCLSTKSLWQNGEIWTDTQFEVVEQAKGALPITVIVRTLGGTLGNLHSRVEETPVFHPGEEALLFLWGRQGETLRVLGWSQGTFRMALDARTGAETVTQDSAAAPLFDPQSRRFVDEGIRNLPITPCYMGVSQPPPNNNPGPSDARKMGLR